MVVIPVTLDYGLTTKAAVSLLLQLSRPGKQFQLRHILMRVQLLPKLGIAPSTWI
jgi:hypothetical protein